MNVWKTKPIFWRRNPARPLANLLTVLETAQRHGHDALAFWYHLWTRSPGRTLCFLYDTR